MGVNTGSVALPRRLPLTRPRHLSLALPLTPPAQTHTHVRGMIVFKLERERPAFSTHQNMLYYVKDRYLRTYDFATQRDNPLIAIRRTGSAGANQVRDTTRRDMSSASPSCDLTQPCSCVRVAFHDLAHTSILLHPFPLPLPRSSPQGPKTLSYNPAENALLITSDVDGGSYELYMVPKEASRGDSAPVGVCVCVPQPGRHMSLPPRCGDESPSLCQDGVPPLSSITQRSCSQPRPDLPCSEFGLPFSPKRTLQESKRGLGTSAVFIARNRFAVLDRAANTIQIRNLQNEITKKCAPPCATTDAVFYAGTGTLLCRSEDKVGGQSDGPVCMTMSECAVHRALHCGRMPRTPWMSCASSGARGGR